VLSFEIDITINLHKKSGDQTWGKSSLAIKLVTITTIRQQVCIWQEAVRIKLTVKKYFKNPQLRHTQFSFELLHSSHSIDAFTASSLAGVRTVHRWPALTCAIGAIFHMTQMLLQSFQYICGQINRVYGCVSVPVWLIHTYLCQDTQCILLCTVQFDYYTNWGLAICHSILSYVYSMTTQSQLNFAVYCQSAVQQSTCFIIMTKLLRSMLPHVIVTLILNIKHLKTHAVSLSLPLFIKKKSHYGKLILRFFPSCIRLSLYTYIF